MRSGVGAHLGVAKCSVASADIWAARIGEHLDRLEDYSARLLSDDERLKLRSYRSRESAERYAVTRSLVRVVLADRLGIEPSKVHVQHTERGKPVLRELLHFNVSHSGDLVLLAVSPDRPVGVDVERRRDIERVQPLVDRWLTPSEREDVRRLTATGLSPSESFLRVWSLKEARLKALGVGIAGAAGASLDHVNAVPLDEVLESLPGTGPAFVGAVAFA